MKKKILILIESLGGGGAEKVLATLLRHIDQSKYEVTLCPIVGTGKYVDEVKAFAHYQPMMTEPTSAFDRMWYALKYKFAYNVLPMSWVYRLFVPKDNDIEIAFCEGFVTKLLASSTNKKAKRITWVHIDLKYNPWPQKLGVYQSVQEETACYSKYDNIICVSKTVEDSFKEVYGLGEKVSTVYNPIDVQDIRKKGCESIPLYDKERLNLVTVGRLVHQKGYDILVRICKRLKDEGYRFTLRILGEGAQQDELQRYITDNGLQDYVKLLGFHPNPYPYIANSDIFVCSSRSEGYSLVIAESLVLGVPVISTYCSGPNELLAEGKYGKLVDISEDGSALYQGLKQLMDDTSALAEYKTKAIERGKMFDIKGTMKAIENILKLNG